MSKMVASVEYGDSKSLFDKDFLSQPRKAVCCSNPKCDNQEVGKHSYLPILVLQSNHREIYKLLTSFSSVWVISNAQNATSNRILTRWSRRHCCLRWTHPHFHRWTLNVIILTRGKIQDRSWQRHSATLRAECSLPRRTPTST